MDLFGKFKEYNVSITMKVIPKPTMIFRKFGAYLYNHEILYQL